MRQQIGKLPVFGCITGISLLKQKVEIFPHVFLSKVYVDTFSTTMMAFAPPTSPDSHHPAPWIPVKEYKSFLARTEIELGCSDQFHDLTIEMCLTIIAAMLRLRIPAPVRIPVIGNLSFNKMTDNQKQTNAIGFENSPSHIGVFEQQSHQLNDNDISWLRHAIPIASDLCKIDRFFRAFNAFEQAQWVLSKEAAIQFLWSSIETLFDLSASTDKAKVISKVVSTYVTDNRSERDKAYQAIKALYQNRGKVVHAAQDIDDNDVLNTVRLAKTAFTRVIFSGKLPELKIN